MVTSAGLHEFCDTARRRFALRIASRVNALGGYGRRGEVIYCRPPEACPTVLMDSRDGATATLMSNGSVELRVQDEPFDVEVLSPGFDAVEKRETGPLSCNVWLAVGKGASAAITSLVNPAAGFGCGARRARVIKLGDPRRAMWFLCEFAPRPTRGYRSALCTRLVATPAGPAILREVFVENTGKAPLNGMLWTCWHLHGTQQFAYNKELWYDSGIPLSNHETVVAASVPYCDMMQVKRLSSAWQGGIGPGDATCDYLSFVGDSSAGAALPEAVRRGALRRAGAGRAMNRFSTPTIAANGFRLKLGAGESAVLGQSLLYVTDLSVRESFRRTAQAEAPSYPAMVKAFRTAARGLIGSTPSYPQVLDVTADRAGGEAQPSFKMELPADRATAFYANSVWTGVEELYENCRAHGAPMADGIELGTRDRGQDMWPKLKQDPARVRADLLHALGFMYRTVDVPLRKRKGLSLREKLHGMFPRQYPSRWLDRSQAVMNDNRPYADSPLWLLNALVRLVRETGDTAVLAETVGTVVLTDPEHPEQSGIRAGTETCTVLQVVLEVLACFERLCHDSPYGMAQIMYGDWCDPIDMFGTSGVGDATTRGNGGGVQVRLSAHVFITLVEVIDMLAPLALARADELKRLKRFADRLRQAVVRVAWEGGKHAGFVDSIHALRKDGSRPRYAEGELGYTLGSMRKTREFDGRPRRVLVSQAWGLAMLLTERAWLSPVRATKQKVAALLRTVDALFFDKALGLRLYTTPLANDEQTRRLAGRMGIVPSGCAENGEYHHAQAMMHYFRLRAPDQGDKMWQQFKPMLSSTRGEDLNGPFDMPCTSYASDRQDPHFGAGMYFGLSGSTDWIVAILEQLAGVELNLHDPTRPDLVINPALPAVLKGRLTFSRVLHVADGRGEYRPLPLQLEIRPAGRSPGRVRINGKAVVDAAVDTLASYDRLHIVAAIGC